jgi:membrane-bound lytic murein transglycosylase F
LLTACNDSEPALNKLDQIKTRGELRVLSRYSPTTYFLRDKEFSGFEYELSQGFADYLGVKLTMIVPDNLASMLSMLQQGQADIAAAGLTVTKDREKIIQFGPVYQEVTQQLVYRQGNPRPRNLNYIQDGILEVVANSSHVEQLKQLQQDHPNLTWIANKDLDSNHLLELVQLELIDYTIADSNEFLANRRRFPELLTAFDISEPQTLAWAMTLSEDNSLAEQVEQFFGELSASGELDKLLEKYYGYVKRFDYVDTRAMHRKIKTHLPVYQSLFQEAAELYQFDWRLLAAISYQESHWSPDAVSSTGVKGMMMLTKATAKRMGIGDRSNPRESIFAGAAYLNTLKKALPERIEEPDRTWLALAAYNIGLGHLEDARVLTQQNNKNPDSWIDVKQHLPLLAKKKWYSQTKYGYARGAEPVRYIENIRRYYSILLYDDGGKISYPEQTQDKIIEPPAAL